MNAKNLNDGERQLLEDIINLFLGYYYSLISIDYNGDAFKLGKKKQVMFERKFLNKHIETLSFDIKEIMSFFSTQRIFAEKKFLKHHIIRGKIAGRRNDSYIVSFRNSIIGILPDRLSLKQDNYMYKESFWFYVRSVNFDIGNNYPIKLTLDRKTNMLPILLLKKKYPAGKFRCKRFLGDKNVIYSNVFVHAEDIKAVQKDVGEKIIFKKN